MTNCKQCGKEMNPIQALLSSTHGVCGDCTRKKVKLIILGKK